MMPGMTLPKVFSQQSDRPEQPEQQENLEQHNKAYVPEQRQELPEDLSINNSQQQLIAEQPQTIGMLIAQQPVATGMPEQKKLMAPGITLEPTEMQQKKADEADLVCHFVECQEPGINLCEW